MNSEFQNPNLDEGMRAKFLKFWQNEYPQPSGVGMCGRMVFADQKVWLERNGEKIKDLVWNEYILFSDPQWSDFLPMEVIQSGDWVEFIEKEQVLDVNTIEGAKASRVRLLSPNRWSHGNRSDVKTVIREWNNFIKKIHSFFEIQGFDFLATPTLVRCPGTEPCLDAFSTEFIHGSNRKVLFLPTSPELHLKKCLAKGWDKIYELRSCFRNGEISEFHQPEFSMLEWYRAFASTNDIQLDVKELIHFLSPDFQSKDWISRSVAELFQQYLQFNLQPHTTMNELVELAAIHQVDVTAAVDFDEVFYFLFLEKIEPQLKNYPCLFLHSYPPSQAALARLTETGWGDRFEFYINGVEIANAFCELNNPVEQRARSLEDLNKKKIYGRLSVSLDEDFFLHLERGMPPSSGIALGMDRLFMVLKGYSDIKEFRLFPLLESN